LIRTPAVAAGGYVLVAAYDRQAYVRRTILTPVLAPAAIAYRR
jgi:hypothetical protein